jgi:hypothetical protein
MAYNEGYTTAEITTSQFVLGIIGILLINLFQQKKPRRRYITGMTRFYYLANISCFHWDCIVDAKRGWGVTRNVLRKKPSAKKW